MPSVPFDPFLLTQKICIPLVSYNFLQFHTFRENDSCFPLNLLASSWETESFIPVPKDSSATYDIPQTVETIGLYISEEATNRGQREEKNTQVTVVLFSLV